MSTHPINHFQPQMQKRALLYSLLFPLLLLVTLSIIYFALHNELHQARGLEQYQEISEMQRKITDELNSVGADLVYFSHSDLAQATLAKSDETAKEFLTSLMLNIGTLQQRYDQLRLLNNQGTEVIRINQQVDLSMEQVDQSRLQNKSDRYYFSEAAELAAGQLHISKFDLNIERGQIERPLKPMIRFSTPIHDANGQLIGVGVLNYNGSRILQLLDKLNVHEGDQIFLLNQDGYFIKSHNPAHEWGFMLPDRADYTFAALYPRIWQELSTSTYGEAVSESGEFYFSTFTLQPSAPLQTTTAETVTLVMHVPYSIIHQGTMVLLQGLVIVFLLLAPALAFLGWQLGGYQQSQAWLFQQLEFEAHHDNLTGLYNRKAIMEFLRRNIMISNRRHSPLSIGFIDLNDLKIMNDQHGHEMGDELIKGVAKAIKEIIRASDAAARIGGDEFLIVFIDCDEQGANQIMQRIERMFNTLGVFHSGMPWSLSHGCSCLKGEQDTAEKMIERADAQMYKHKQQHKQKKAG